MIVIKDKNNMCRTAVKYKERSSGTKQLELNFLTDSTSHNIYNLVNQLKHLKGYINPTNLRELLDLTS